jgi:phage terminase large subunit-like protein
MMQPTRADVEKCIGWHKLAHPLLIEPGESQILVVGTRWVEDDLLEWIMKNEKHYHLTMRAVREDADGNPDPKGEIVWAETDDGRVKFNEEVLNELEAALGPYMFSTLYLNCPQAAGNMPFKPTWINYYDKLPKGLIKFTSIDLASAKDDSSSDPDFSITLTCGVNPDNGHIYIIDYDRQRYDPGEHIDSIFNHYRLHKFMKLIAEAIGYQRTLCYWIEQKQMKNNILFPVEQVVSYTASKDHRIRALIPLFANTRVFLSKDMPELEAELVNFPYGRHDDLIDCLSAQIPSWFEVIDETTIQKKKYQRNYQPGSAAYILDEIMEGQKKELNYSLEGIGNFKPKRQVLLMPRSSRFLNN